MHSATPLPVQVANVTALTATAMPAALPAIPALTPARSAPKASLRAVICSWQAVGVGAGDAFVSDQRGTSTLEGDAHDRMNPPSASVEAAPV